MYFSRTGNLADLLMFLCQSSLWVAGGWLLVTHCFSLRRDQRAITGIATGWLLFIALVNLFAQVLPTTIAFWGAAGVILVAGIGAAFITRPARGSRVPWSDWLAWQPLAWLVGSTLLFELIGRGLAIFDDYVHLPLTSIVGAGDIPPHFYADPSIRFAYHYGLHLFAGSLERIGGLFPWSAWDLSKAFSIALTLVLGWVWARRVTHSQIAASLGSLLIVFGGGARWLLLLLPHSWLETLSTHTQMIGTAQASGSTLIEAMISPWKLDGGPPTSIPFAFHNGVFVPAEFILGSNSDLPFVAILVLLILVGRRWRPVAAIPIITLVLGTLALSGEHLFVFLWGGIALCLFVYLLQGWLRKKNSDNQPKMARLAWSWGGILVLSLGLSLIQGGYLTDAAYNLLGRLAGSPQASINNFWGFALRWPPAITTAHLAPLSLLDPYQLVIALAELGPAILLALPVTVLSIRWMRRGNWLWAGFGFSGIVAFLFSIFFVYGLERSETRLAATSLWTWVVLGIPILWLAWKRGRRWMRPMIAAGFGMAVFSGLTLFAIQLTAIQVSNSSYFLEPADSSVAALYWNRLEPSAQIFDPMPERAVTVFGRASRSRPWIYTTYPDYDALVAKPDPVAIARDGYTYAYFDNGWFSHLPPSIQEAYHQPCVRLVYSLVDRNVPLRWLYDVRNCR